MKALVLFALLCPAYAQTIRPNALACGSATLTLSMPQARVTQVLKYKGYTLLHTDPAADSALSKETWLDKVDDSGCHVSFNEGKLVYVARYWQPRKQGDLGAVEAMVDAVQSVTQSRKHNLCDVFSYTDTRPSGSFKSIDIICNGHTIEISVTDDKIQTYDIEESIGSFLKKP